MDKRISGKVNTCKAQFLVQPGSYVIYNVLTYFTSGAFVVNYSYCMKLMLHTFNSQVSTGTNQCIDKAVHMLFMYRLVH